MITSEGTKDIADRLSSAVKAGSKGELEKLFSPSLTLWDNFTGLEKSRADAINMAASLSVMFSDFRFDAIRRNFFEGGYVQQHTVRGVASNGSAFAFPACLVVFVEHGQIQRVEEYFDSAHLPK